METPVANPPASTRLGVQPGTRAELEGEPRLDMPASEHDRFLNPQRAGAVTERGAGPGTGILCNSPDDAGAHGPGPEGDETDRGRARAQPDAGTTQQLRERDTIGISSIHDHLPLPNEAIVYALPVA